MPENRIIGNYLARKKTVISPRTGKVWADAPIVMLHLFLQPYRYEWVYGVFDSEESFNLGKLHSADFNISYILTGSELSSFKAANNVLIPELFNRFRPICRPVAPENALLEYANFDITNWKLSIKFEGNDVPQRELNNEDYNRTISENMDVIGFVKNQQGEIVSLGIVPILDQIAFQKDPDFWAGATYIFPSE